MKNRVRFSLVNLLVGTVALAGFGSLPTAANAKVQEMNMCLPGNGKTQEECDCEAALKTNTIQALEAFLRKYPLNGKPSVCGAMAFNALTKFDGGGGGYRPPPGGSNGGYGG